MRFVALLVLVLFAPLVEAQAPPAVLSMRERAEVQDRWLAERLDTVIPALMRREGIDMWIVSAREYNEDPVIETMLPATWLAARRRTTLVFYDDGETVERLAVARYDVGPFPRAWDPETQPDQWARVAEIIDERNPQRIGVNRSSTFALADGLTGTEYQAFLEALTPSVLNRVVSAEKLAVGWLETRIPAEMDVYPTVVRIARAILHEGLSEAAITPGVTTTDDLSWWYRDRIRSLGLTTWFHPSVSVQRADAPGRSDDFSGRPDLEVIQPGDLVWVDFGISYLGLQTDTQQLAYVLRPGETSAPAGLEDGMRAANRVQDVLTDQFATGRSGNAILASALGAPESKASTPPSTRIPSACTATPPGRPSGCGTSRVACRVVATTRSIPTQHIPSSSTPSRRCRSGAASASASAWRRTRSSTARRSATSTRGRRRCC